VLREVFFRKNREICNPIPNSSAAIQQITKELSCKIMINLLENWDMHGCAFQGKREVTALNRTNTFAFDQRHVRAARANPLGNSVSSDTAFVTEVAPNSWLMVSAPRKEVLPGY
jgi:hypothetical protein